MSFMKSALSVAVLATLAVTANASTEETNLTQTTTTGVDNVYAYKNNQVNLNGFDLTINGTNGGHYNGLIANSSISGSGNVKLTMTGGPVLGSQVSENDISIKADSIWIESDSSFAIYSINKDSKLSLQTNGRDLVANTITIKAKNEAGIFAQGGAIVEVSNFGTLNVSTASDTDDSNAIKNNGGNIIIKDGGKLNVQSDLRGAVINDPRATTPSSTQISVDSFEVTSTIDPSLGEKDAAAIYVGNGDMTITTSEMVVTATNKATGEAMNALHVADNNEVTIDATSTTLSGNVQADTGSNVNIKGNTTINGTVSTESTSNMKLEGETTLNGKIDAQGDVEVDGNVTIGKTAGNDNTIATLKGDNAKVTFTSSDTKLTVNNIDGNLTVGATGALNDELGGDISKLQQQFTTTTDADNSYKVDMQAGTVTGQVTGTVDASGKAEVTESVNPTNKEVADVVTLVPAMIARTEMNDLRKRMGDIRSSETTHGAWARYEGGKMSGMDTEYKFNKVQVGIDTVPTPDAMRVGVAFSYSNGDMDGAHSGIEMDTYSLAAYGIWLGDNGQFADIIGRMAVVKSDLTTSNFNTNLDQFAMSLSGEFGWRFDVTDSFYVEPSIEGTYTFLNSESFEGAGAKFNIDDTRSFTGKLSTLAGFKCPANKGDVYARVSLAHEFFGDAKMTAQLSDTVRAIETNGSETWVEYAVGANINLSKSTYIWADVERTAGADIEEDWRGTVGIRYNF